MFTINLEKKYVSIGILAHVDAGKTTLSEALLYKSGAVNTLGRVDNKDAFLDTFSLEKQRGITIFSKQALIDMNEFVITLLDTPGHVDFSAEMERTLSVLNYAILVISGADGVQAHTKTLWSLLSKYEIPTFVFVNKMDQSGTDKEKVLKALEKLCGDGVVDFTKKDTDEFNESIAVTDEVYLEKYLEGVSFLADYKKLVKERKLFPCFFGSALKYEGVEYFYEEIQNMIEASEDKSELQFGAKVFKISRDEKNNRLTHLLVTSGKLDVKMQIGDEKVNEIRVYSGEKYKTVQSAKNGMVVACLGLKKTYPGMGLGINKSEAKPVLSPVLSYKINLPESVNVQEFLPKLMQLNEEQPELNITWNEKINEIHALVMGRIQIEILESTIMERFGVKVSFGTGNIIYKETITDSVVGVGHYEPLRHYAEVQLLLEPAKSAMGICVDSIVNQDDLDLNWQRLIFTHIMEKNHKGVLVGADLTDVKITLVNGRAHLKHTEGGDFRQATYRAIRQGLMQAKSCLLEPYYRFTIKLPNENIGRAIADIERMNGTFTLEDDEITGMAPVVNMRDYQTEVMAYTKGQGVLTLTPCGYFPCHNESEVIMSKKYEPEADLENTPDSVFCSHGAGFNVKWNEVKNYMHLPAYEMQRDENIEKSSETTQVRKKIDDEFIDIEEIDTIISQSQGANKNKQKASHKGISKDRIRRTASKPVGLSKPRQKKKTEKYLLVDGYNIIFAWDDLNALAKDNINSARDKLMDIMCNYQGYAGEKVIVVFDAYRVKNHKTEFFSYNNINVVYTKEAETADQYIEKFAHENAKNCDITVATSDGLEQIIIRGEGCRLLSARQLQIKVKEFAITDYL